MLIQAAIRQAEFWPVERLSRKTESGENRKGWHQSLSATPKIAAGLAPPGRPIADRYVE
jgi:hypothetical protein